MRLGTLLLAGAWLAALVAIEPDARAQQAAELSVRHPAALIPIAGTPHIVHELWIQNRLPAAVLLHAVTVSDDGALVSRFEGADLRSRVGRPGLPRTHPTPLTLEPDQPAVVYFWIPLPAGAPVPRRLQHRVTLVPAETAADVRPLVVEGGLTTVSPVDDVEVLGPPLEGPGWAAVYEPAMVGGHRTTVYTVDGVSRIPGRFAIDWIRLLPSGRVHTDAASRPSDWNGFGADVLAVKDARVVRAVDGHLDAADSGKPREPISRDNAAGNHIALELGPGRFAFYEHLQHGSVGVKVGDRVRRGQVIARLGSSGSVSSGPHLHFHVADASSPLGAEGLPFVIREFRLRGAFASIEAFARGDAAAPTASGVDPLRRAERPGPNTVVDFGNGK